jgi:hypothetical protein
MSIKQNLEKQHTKILLRYLNIARMCGFCTIVIGRNVVDVTEEEIKEVLATREHIRNKSESKKFRRENAKRNRGQGKSKNR